jgi:hypothetical protein
VDWTPVERAAVLTSREGLDAAHQYMLDFAGAVAARHERNEGVLPLPTAEFLESCPVEIAARVLAHLVQHAADTGAPDPEAVRRASQPYRAPSPRLAYLSQLRLEGALARLDAVTGQPRRALVTHRALADLFLDSDLPGEVSFPLSEAYRLAGVLGDRAAFDECERTAARTDAMGGLGLEGSPYVRLARGQALARLGEHAAASDDLSPLAVSAELPAHVRWCAVRWLLQCGGVLESSDITTRAEDALAAAATDPPRVAHAAHVQRALVSLDRGLRGGKEGTAAALDTMRELEAGMVTLLLRWTTPGDEAGHVARHYPY